MENELFKLVTRRLIFWFFVPLATLTLTFFTVWGALTEQIELVTLGAGALAVELGTIIAFLTSKKLSEK